MDAALGFVIRRIEEQAMRSGQPLDEDQRFLLNNLPKYSDAPQFNTGDPEFPVYFVPRDTSYERLCSLAKAAHHSDLELNPGSHDWEFAFNVSKLNRHPMCWLLQWPGVKQRRPWWDRWLLIIAALQDGSGTEILAAGDDNAAGVPRQNHVIPRSPPSASSSTAHSRVP